MDKLGLPQPFTGRRFRCPSVIRIRRFIQALFGDETMAKKAAEIGQAILAARSLRLTDIAAQMSGRSNAGYKRIQRFVQQANPRQALWRLFPEQAEFVTGDPAEIERRQAWKTGLSARSKMARPKASGRCCWRRAFEAVASRVA